MLKIFVLGLIAVLSGSVSAAWTPSVQDDAGLFIIYVDRTTIQKTGNIASMWSLLDFKKPRRIPGFKPYQSAKKFEEFDCEKQLIRLQTFVAYSGKMGTGTVLESVDEDQAWKRVVPGSVMKGTWDVACEK